MELSLPTTDAESLVAELRALDADDAQTYRSDTPTVSSSMDAEPPQIARALDHLRNAGGKDTTKQIQREHERQRNGPYRPGGWTCGDLVCDGTDRSDELGCVTGPAARDPG